MGNSLGASFLDRPTIGPRIRTPQKEGMGECPDSPIGESLTGNGGRPACCKLRMTDYHQGRRHGDWVTSAMHDKNKSTRPLTQVSCVYTIDAGDMIVSVDGSWSLFARENEGQAAATRRVLHTSLWNHISGLENRMIYKEILDGVRETLRPVRFPFRCDAPDCRRDLEMVISPLPHRACRFQTLLIHAEPRPRLHFLDPHAHRTGLAVLVCNWCMRVEDLQGKWIELDKAIRVMRLEKAREPAVPAFTICPDCLDSVKQRLEESARG